MNLTEQSRSAWTIVATFILSASLCVAGACSAVAYAQTTVGEPTAFDLLKQLLMMFLAFVGAPAGFVTVVTGALLMACHVVQHGRPIEIRFLIEDREFMIYLRPAAKKSPVTTPNVET